MAAAIIGGQLVQHLPPSSALHAAAAIVGVTPFLVIIGTLLLIPEQKVSINLQGMKSTLDGFLASFKRRELWIIAVFIFLYYFSPGFATPLYYHMTDNLKFSQGYIGILASIASAGWVVGALLYRRFFGDLSLKNLLNVSIAFGTVTTAAYLLLSTETSAAILNFCSGFSAMLATVATLTLAADYCPPRAEGFAFATLMSIINLATTLADNVGSFLYTHLFHGNLTPLVLVSAAFTAIRIRAGSAPSARRQAARRSGGKPGLSGTFVSILKKPILGPRQTQIFAQRRAFVFAAEQAAPLQLGNDLDAKIFEPARQIREHHRKAVGALGLDPLLHLVRDGRGCADHGKAGKAAEPLRKLAHGQILPAAERNRALTPTLGGIAFRNWSGSGLSGSNFEASWPRAIDNDAMALA